MLRPDEEYVLKVLAKEFGGEYEPGEDPPDGYLMLPNRRVAVEVSRLIENVTNQASETYPRLKDDASSEKMVSELDAYFSGKFPEGLSVFLMLNVPLKNIRKTKQHLIGELEKFAHSSGEDYETTICGNHISISRLKSQKCSVGAGYANRFSSSNITENVSSILENRISAKNRKMRQGCAADEYWLALLNHYWVARADSYRVAYQSLELRHEFDKVFVISEYGEAELIS